MFLEDILLRLHEHQSMESTTGLFSWNRASEGLGPWYLKESGNGRGNRKWVEVPPQICQKRILAISQYFKECIPRIMHLKIEGKCYARNPDP